MSKKHFATFIASLIGGSSLFAQAQKDSAVRQLDEVVVTATKSPKKASETGKVVMVISKTDLERSGAKDLSQILNNEAGIIVNGANSNPGKDKSIYMRGATNAYTVILINGIPVSDPSGVGGAFDLRLLPVEQIERIEILKGGQSTLYGSDAVAGVINIITKKSDGKPAQLYGSLSAGSYGTLKSNAGISGSSEKASYTVNFIHYQTNGISEAKDTAAVKTFDKDGYMENAFSADFDARPLKGLDIKPFFRYAYYKGGYDDGHFTDAPNTFTSQLISAGAGAQYNFQHGSVNALYGYNEVNSTYTDSYGASPFSGTRKILQVYSHYNFSQHIQVLAGLDYDKQLLNDTNASPKNPQVSITSPYLSFFLKNLDGFSLELGGRYNKHSRYGNNSTYSINPSYLISEKVKIFANIATAFRAPALYSLYGQYGANPDLKPETSTTYEGGVQASLLSDKLEARVVYYSRKINNVIIYGPAFSYINLNTQNNHGIEIEPIIHFTRELTLKLFYAYTKGRVTTQSSGKDTSYDNLIRIPRNSFGADLGYQVTPALFVSTHVSSYGQRNDLFFDNTTFTQTAVVLKSYALWDAYAEYALAKRKLKVFFSIQNITGKDYYEVYGYSVMGRNVNGGIRVAL